MARIVHISANGDEPVKTVKRQEGKYNFGLYCSKCTQFFALAVLDDLPMRGAEFTSDGDPFFVCPYCHHQQRRQVSEIVQVTIDPFVIRLTFGPRLIPASIRPLITACSPLWEMG